MGSLKCILVALLFLFGCSGDSVIDPYENTNNCIDMNLDNMNFLDSEKWKLINKQIDVTSNGINCDDPETEFNECLINSNFNYIYNEVDLQSYNYYFSSSGVNTIEVCNNSQVCEVIDTNSYYINSENNLVIENDDVGCLISVTPDPNGISHPNVNFPNDCIYNLNNANINYSFTKEANEVKMIFNYNIDIPTNQWVGTGSVASFNSEYELICDD